MTNQNYEIWTLADLCDYAGLENVTVRQVYLNESKEPEPLTLNFMVKKGDRFQIVYDDGINKKSKTVVIG
jgi:hypothetical protein